MKKTPKIFQKINLRIPLPSLPQTLFQVVRKCCDPHYPMENIVRFAVTDPALALKLLQVSRHIQPQTLSYASLLAAAESLGPNHLKNLALTRLMRRRTNPWLQKSSFPFYSFWLRSLGCAMLAENMMKEIRRQQSQDAYLAGLLCGCGVLLLWANFGNKYETIWNRHHEDPDSLREKEIEVFGADHPTVARHLLASMNLHPLISAAVFHQQRSAREIAFALPLTQAVHTSVFLNRSGNIGNLAAATPKIALPFESRVVQQAAAKTDLQIARRLQELQTSLPAIRQTEEQPPEHFLPADMAEHFYSDVVVPLSLQSAESAPVEDIPLRLHQALLLFFELAPACLFEYNADGESLVVRSGSMPTDIDTVQLRLGTQAGLLAQCLSRQKIIDSFGYLSGEEDRSVFDREMLALLGTEGMICIPLIHQNRKIGVLCAGVAESQMPWLLTELDRLEQFGRQASRLPALPPQTDLRQTSPAAAADSSGAFRRVVHEVNTPLAIIKNYLALLSSKIADNAEAIEDIQLIREEIDRIPVIIGQLHRPNREDRKTGESFDINETIEDLIRLLEKSVFKDTRIRLQFRPDRDLPKFYGRKNHLLQVLTNLLKNSAEAMPAGGTVVVETRLRPVTDAVADRIQITVKDDGPGIPAEIMAKLFEPGNSTKGPEHFGLGLSICKDIVELYDGTITATSRPDQGAVFRIHLPAYGLRDGGSG